MVLVTVRVCANLFIGFMITVCYWILYLSRHPPAKEKSYFQLGQKLLIRKNEILFRRTFLSPAFFMGFGNG